MTAPPPDFAGRIVRWQRAHGRNGLPWQASRDPYRVWLSEIMLQQTQVATVLGYYPRFLDRFPDVQALADGTLDEVLALWSGLGYYSRGRNLHRCAQQVVAGHGGHFPRSAALLQTLPGIGRSTAAAIAAFCFGERVAILDGNVKRVLCRLLAYGQDPSAASSQRELWRLAVSLLPAVGAEATMPAYTQGLMDLGATLCLRRRPGCPQCPVNDPCQARALGQTENYPVRRRKPRRSAQSWWLLRAESGTGSVWLEKRPVPGIWAGLFCLPQFDSREALEAALPSHWRAGLREEAPLRHMLTHKDLLLHPVAAGPGAAAKLGSAGAWFGPAQWPALGLPAPVRKLLEAGARPVPGGV